MGEGGNQVAVRGEGRERYGTRVPSSSKFRVTYTMYLLT